MTRVQDLSILIVVKVLECKYCCQGARLVSNYFGQGAMLVTNYCGQGARHVSNYCGQGAKLVTTVVRVPG